MNIYSNSLWIISPLFREFTLKNYLQEKPVHIVITPVGFQREEQPELPKNRKTALTICTVRTSLTGGQTYE